MASLQPLSSSPALSSSSATTTRTPPLGADANTLDKASPAAAETTVGLGVSGADGLEPAEDAAAGLGATAAAKADVTSPLELTQFVDTLLNDLESRFDSLSSDVLSRLNSLSTRVDSLETSLADLMSGSNSLPPASSASGASSAAATPAA
ncbi:hypothetical protein JCM8202_001198 [Rhodotorula sphaerocarpa]